MPAARHMHNYFILPIANCELRILDSPAEIGPLHHFVNYKLVKSQFPIPNQVSSISSNTHVHVSFGYVKLVVLVAKNPTKHKDKTHAQNYGYLRNMRTDKAN